MSLDRLKDALVVAKESKDLKKLGRFGMGMKSACSNLGKSFTLTTAQPDSELEFTARYDEDQWLADKSKGWTNFEIKENAKKRKWHGTIITITNLKIPLYPNQSSSFRTRFGIRYGPYLKNRQVRIRINSKYCREVTPELEKDTRQELAIMLPGGFVMSGWIGLLERRSVKGDYGIHLYRKGRLIRAFEKFGIRNHPEVARIVGEISLDHVPVNFHKTGFLEDTLEYMEAASRFRNDPAVANLLRRSSAQKVDASEIRSIFEYGPETIPKKPIDTRLSAANAKSMLRKAEGFTVQTGSMKLDLEFKDMGGIYLIDCSDDRTKVTVNRSSGAFTAFKNPLFLLGLVRIETELVAGNPKYAAFVDERNKRWGEFLSRFLPSPLAKHRPDKNVPVPTYSLWNELIDLHDYLKVKFWHDFQFTGLSTLAPFLHNAYRKHIYSMQTINGAGQELLETITDHDEKFMVLLNPKPLEVETMLNISREDRIIIIREYAERLASTWASPEKAWLDLCVELRKSKISTYADELQMLLDELLDSHLANPKKLRSLARRRKLLDMVETYLAGE